MAGNLTAMIASIFSGGVTPDPYYKYTTLLLPGNGTNGAQNNTFLDGSTNNFTITRNGNTTQGTFSPFSQTGWGNLFVSASSQYLSLSSSSFAVGTGAFTIEGWVYLNSYTYGSVFSTWNAANTGVGMMLGFDNTGKIQFSIGNASGSADTTIVTASSISLNTWVFLQATKAAGSGGAMTIYINGTSSATTTTTRSVDRSAAVIGRYYQDTAGNQINGYLSNVRVSNTVRSSTVPTAPFTNDANTLLLTCQSNRFLDVSSTPITITPNGSPTVVAFSPFNPTASWSAATYGGSGYFDGSGDYLSLANNAAFDFNADPFTIETWFYITGNAAQNGDLVRVATLFCAFPTSGSTANVYNLYLDGNGTTTGTGIGFSKTASGSNVNVSYAATIAQNTWHHVAVVRSSSTTLTLYLNGQQVAQSTSYSGNVNTGGNPISVAQLGYVNYLNQFPGYISNTRVVKGTAVYTGAFTPPSLLPLTNAGSTSAAAYPSTNNVNTSFASSATSLLLNFTNAGIYDATSKNDLETVGNAQISTAISAKWGTGSIKLTSASSDYLKSPSSNLYVLGTGDWTIECWVYLPSVATQQIIFDTRATGTDSGYAFYVTGVGKLALFTNNTSVLVTSSLVPSNSWAYLAMTRTGATVRAYINGTLDATTGTYSGSMNCPGTALVGAGAGGTDLVNGYIQDLRITKGYARTVTASPTAAFPTL
jgi:hypothetical protein